MHILILSWRGIGHPLAGGAEQVTWQYATGWAKAGHQVTLITSRYVGHLPLEFKAGVDIIRRGDQFIGVRLAAIFWYWFGKHGPINLVVDEFHGIPFFTPLWAFKSQIIGFIHEIAQPVWALNTWPKPWNLLPATVGKWAEPWIFKLFYGDIPFMTVSESTKSDLQRFGVKHITVIPNGVILPQKLPQISKEKDFTIIYLSALTRDKGVEDAVAAFNIVQEQVPAAKFWIVGKGSPDYISYLQSLCPQAKFWGYVPESLKFKLLSRAHVLVFPSVHEGWGLVVIEANSLGVPAVGYRVRGITDSVKDGKTGLLASPGDISELARLVINLSLDSQAYRKLSQNALQWAQQFNWSISVKRSLKLLNISCQEYQ